jgi:hypothetical protein
MTAKKQREKVVAEITVAHLTEFASEIGRKLDPDEAVAFLNQNGRAYAMWQHMMRAGEDYIKSTLGQQGPAVVSRQYAPEIRRRSAAV